MKKLNAIDKQNLDGVYGATAVALDWPENLSEKAKKALDYLDDTAYLFHYLGKYIITDESLWLTEFGNGTMDSPFGFPRIAVLTPSFRIFPSSAFFRSASVSARNSSVFRGSSSG